MHFNYLGAVVFCELLNVQSDSYVTSLFVFFSFSIEELSGVATHPLASNCIQCNQIISFCNAFSVNKSHCIMAADSMEIDDALYR